MIQRKRLAIFVWPALLTLVLAVALWAPGMVVAQSPGQAAKSNGDAATPKSLDDLLAIQHEVQSVVNAVLPATVGIRVESSQGSGVIVSSDGFVLTAGHVIGRPGLKASIILSDGMVVQAKTLGVYETADIGLLKIDGDGPWPSVERGRSSELTAGTWCVAVGHPLGYQEGRPPVVRVGRVLRMQENQIQTDCPLVAGDSGGPLFNLQGKIVGINSRIGGSTDMNYHIPVDVFARNWGRLVNGDLWEDELPRKESGSLQDVLSRITAAARRCVVRVECRGSDVALGTIVGSDGWILTKASELSGPAICRFSDGRRYQATLVGVDKQFDLALLRIAATGLPGIPWNARAESPVGQWVATLGWKDQSPAALGVVSVPRRRIPPVRGVLGVGVGRGDGGALVARVLPDTPAQRAGLRENDVITQVDGRAVPDQENFLEYLRQRVPGDVLKLVLRRGQTILQLSVTLDRIDTAASRKREIQNISDIGVSRRHDDFPVVLQHDTVLRPTECGGPLVDLKGQVIGINVARGGRTETYSVPTDVLLPLVERLKSGKSASLPMDVAASPSSSEPRLASTARSERTPTGHADDLAPPVPSKQVIAPLKPVSQ